MHGTGANVAVQPADPRVWAANVVLDWNHCGDFTIDVFLKTPFAFVGTVARRARFVFVGPVVIVTRRAGSAVPPAGGGPPTVPAHRVWLFPLTFTVTFFFATFCVIWVGRRTIDCASTLPSAFAWPRAGVYGVHSERQRYSPVAGGLTIAVFEKLAERSFAPNVARPGVPAGTSGGGRHTAIFHAATAFSAGVASTGNIGMSSVCPAAGRWRYHVCPGGAGPRHAVCCAANCVADDATSRSPSSGSTAPARSTAEARAVTEPSFAPPAGVPIW